MKKNHLLLGLLLLIPAAYAAAQGVNVVWSHDFEGDWTQNWYADAGTWEGGTPTVGPASAHSGTQCAGTALDGNYNSSVDSRLVKISSFTVPEATENPRLRFWHWFNFTNNDDDWGRSLAICPFLFNNSIRWSL